MKPVHLHHVWNYTDRDREFWHEYLEDWLPQRIFDAHTHIIDPSLRRRPLTEEMRRQYWVNEVDEPIDAESAERCIRITFNDREVECLAFGSVSLDFDTEACNEYVRVESLRRGWHCLAVVPPQFSADKIASELEKPGVIGVKPYYSLIGEDRVTRDAHLEADIFDFLPHHMLEVLNDRGAWVTLHVPKRDRLGHPANIAQIKEIRKRYPNVVLVIAHLGRCYTEPHAAEAIPQLAEDTGLYFDISAVLNPAVLRIALEQIGPDRLLYGTDNPVFYMRGCRQWSGREYINRTDHDFHFNKKREPPQVEARYTLYMYETVKAIKDVCEELDITREQVEKIFHSNAEQLIRRVIDDKPRQEQYNDSPSKE